MIGFYIDISKLPQDNEYIRNEIIKMMPPSGIFYDSNNFHTSNILLLTWDNGTPCQLRGCNTEKDSLFTQLKMRCGIFGKTRLVNFLRYIHDPYNEFLKRNNMQNNK